jgi:transposase-like protein
MPKNKTQITPSTKHQRLAQELNISFDGLGDLQKIARQLKTSNPELSERLQDATNRVAKAFHNALAVYEKQEQKKIHVGNTNASKYSPAVIKQAITKFNSLPNTLSQMRKAELVAASLADPKPSPKTILNWIKASK